MKQVCGTCMMQDGTRLRNGTAEVDCYLTEGLWMPQDGTCKHWVEFAVLDTEKRAKVLQKALDEAKTKEAKTKEAKTKK